MVTSMKMVLRLFSLTLLGLYVLTNVSASISSEGEHMTPSMLAKERHTTSDVGAARVRGERDTLSSKPTRRLVTTDVLAAGGEDTGSRLMGTRPEQAIKTDLLSKIDLGRLKQLLVQAQMEQEQQPRITQSPGETLHLSLEESIAIALQHNLDIQIATLTRDAVQTEIRRTKAFFHPTVGLAFIASEERVAPETGLASETNRQEVAAFIAQEVPTGASVAIESDLNREETPGDSPPRDFQAAVTVSVVQPLLRGGRVFVATRSIRDAEFDTQIEEARLRAEILKVILDTKTAYFEMALAQKIIAVTEEAIERDKTLVEASQAMFEAGLVTKRDVFSAGIILANDRARLAGAQSDLALAKNDLLNVLGLSIGSAIELLDIDIGFRPIRFEVERWIDAATTHRPEVLEVEAQLTQSLLNIRVARNDVLPQLDLVGSAGRAQRGSTIGRAVDLDGWAWSVGLAFSIPLGNVAARASLTRSEIEHTRLERQLVQAKRQVELEVRAAVIKLRESFDRMEARRAGVEQAQGKLEVAKARFALGQATNLDITDAQEDLLDAEVDLLSAIVDYNIGLAELEASIAGPIKPSTDTRQGARGSQRVARAR